MYTIGTTTSQTCYYLDITLGECTYSYEYTDTGNNAEYESALELSYRSPGKFSFYEEEMIKEIFDNHSDKIEGDQMFACNYETGFTMPITFTNVFK